MPSHRSDHRSRTDPQPLVRPRWVWGGLVVALTGLLVAAVGLVALSWTLSVLGTALLIAGIAGSFRGGVQHDSVSSFDLTTELRQARDGAVHKASAGRSSPSEAARREATESNRVTRDLERAAAGTRVAFAPLAGWVLLLSSIAILAAEWQMFAATQAGRNNDFRDTGLAVILALTGLRLALSRGRHPVAVGVAAVAGLCLIFVGFLARHDHGAVAALEVVAGAIAVLVSLASGVSPEFE